MPTAEEFAAMQKALAEATRRSESLVGELRVVTTERDLALERLRALQRQLFAAKSEARGTDQKDLFLNEAEALAPTAQTLPSEIDDDESTAVAGQPLQLPVLTIKTRPVRVRPRHGDRTAVVSHQMEIPRLGLMNSAVLHATLLAWPVGCRNRCSPTFKRVNIHPTSNRDMGTLSFSIRSAR